MNVRMTLQKTTTEQCSSKICTSTSRFQIKSLRRVVNFLLNWTSSQWEMDARPPGHRGLESRIVSLLLGSWQKLFMHIIRHRVVLRDLEYNGTTNPLSFKDCQNWILLRAAAHTTSYWASWAQSPNWIIIKPRPEEIQAKRDINSKSKCSMSNPKASA